MKNLKNNIQNISRASRGCMCSKMSRNTPRTPKHCSGAFVNHPETSPNPETMFGSGSEPSGNFPERRNSLREGLQTFRKLPRTPNHCSGAFPNLPETSPNAETVFGSVCKPKFTTTRIPVPDPKQQPKSKMCRKNYTHKLICELPTPVKRNTHVGIPLAMPQGHSKKFTLL